LATLVQMQSHRHQSLMTRWYEDQKFFSTLLCASGVFPGPLRSTSGTLRSRPRLELHHVATSSDLAGSSLRLRVSQANPGRHSLVRASNVVGVLNHIGHLVESCRASKAAELCPSRLRMRRLVGCKRPPIRS